MDILPEDKLVSVKEEAMVAMGPCAVCGKPQLAHGGMFYRVTIERGWIDHRNIRKHVGMAEMMGGGAMGFAMASVMGPGLDFAKIITAPVTVFVGEECASDIGHLLMLVESAEKWRAQQAPKDAT